MSSKSTKKTQSEPAPTKARSPTAELWSQLGKKYGVPKKDTEAYEKKAAEFIKLKKKLAAATKKAEKEAAKITVAPVPVVKAKVTVKKTKPLLVEDPDSSSSDEEEKALPKKKAVAKPTKGVPLLAKKGNVVKVLRGKFVPKEAYVDLNQ